MHPSSPDCGHNLSSALGTWHACVSRVYFEAFHVAAFQAEAGRAFNLRELLLGEVCTSTVALAAASQVFSIESAVFKQMLQNTPQLQQILIKDVSQQLAASQATSQVLLL